MSLNLDPRQRAMLAELGVRVWWPEPAVASASAAVEGAPGVLQDAIYKEASGAVTPSVRGQKHINHSGISQDAIPSAASVAVQAAGAAIRAAAVPTATAGDTPRSGSALRQLPPNRAALLPGPAALLPLPSGIASMDWPALSAAVASCQACHLCLGRQAAVFVPPPAALRCDWLVLGEPPDDAQERAAQPFVDDAGKLLDNMLKAVGVRRALSSDARATVSVAAAAICVAPVTPAEPPQIAYLSHVLKCRPARPTAPDAAALAACAHYLRREIALLQPKVILAMGRFAMQLLLSEDHPDGLTLPLGKLRGRVWQYQGVPVVVTYPPAYLLRHGQDKARAWADLCLALDVVQGVVSPV